MDLSQDYANSDYIPGAAQILAGLQATAAAFRQSLGAGARTDIAYGPSPREKLDLFLPQTAPLGLMVFVHGGYWTETDKSLWSHLAAGAVARGWACAMPGYTLAPQASIAEITAQVAAAIAHAGGLVPGPLVVTGHSAGGHLAARMANLGLPGVVRVVPISPVADLAPLIHTHLNQSLHLTQASAASESPARHPLPAHISAHVWVGAQERPAFLWQARTLSENWNCPWTPEPGKHHFNVIDGLTDPNSPLMQCCLGGMI